LNNDCKVPNARMSERHFLTLSWVRQSTLMIPEIRCLIIPRRMSFRTGPPSIALLIRQAPDRGVGAIDQGTTLIPELASQLSV
jgi:hypothetical protein